MKNKIDFYDKITLNNSLEVDLNYILKEDGVFVFSNKKLEKMFLKNSIDKISGYSNDKDYKSFLEILNNILINKKNTKNLLIKSNKDNGFIGFICTKHYEYIEFDEVINDLLKENDLSYYLIDKIIRNREKEIYYYRLKVL